MAAFLLPSRARRRLVAPVLLLVATLALLRPDAALAHALLVRADPAPESVVARAPDVATVTFSEALNPVLTRVRVTDAAGRAVTPDTGHLAPGHGGMTWQLALPSLAPGVYSVYWTSASATDGHVRSSFYSFRVAPVGGAARVGAAGGVGAPVAAGGAGFGAIMDAGSAATAFFTWLGYLGQAAWLGALIVELAVLAPARRAPATPPGRLALAAAPRLCWLARGALTLALGALLGEIVSLAVQATGGDWGAALTRATLGGLFSGQNGRLLLARQALLLAALVLAGRVAAPAPSPAASPVPARALGIVAPGSLSPLPLMLRWEVGRWPLALAALAYLALVALSGHAVTVGPGLISYPTDWLHLAGAAAWAGGIAALALAVLPARAALAPAERAPAVLPLLDRFSPVASLSVGLLALSGLYNAVVHVGAPATLVGTTYGQLLVVKLALVGVLILLSASHVYRLRPRIARSQQSGAHDDRAVAAVHEGLATLAGWLRLEAGVGAAILLATALMTQTLPAPVAATTAGGRPPPRRAPRRRSPGRWPSATCAPGSR